jgi:hypothetical protein
MKHYVVCPSPNKQKYAAVVIATGTSRPQEELEQVAAELREQGGPHGPVVFDLLTTNGTKTRRYFALQFDGRDFPEVRFSKIEPDEALRNASASFFSSHLDEVDLSLVTPAMRFALREGLAV